jgi:transcriptional regulator GlxA family with amidase domain
VQPGRHLCYTNSEALHTVYEMLSVDILVLDQFSLMCVAATVEPLRAANRVAAQALYRWRLLSFDGTAPTSTSGITVAMDAAFAPEEARDVLFVVGSSSARGPSRNGPAARRPWERRRRST